VTAESIQEGFDVFVHDGEKAFGAVREARKGSAHMIVYVEGAGDFSVPLAAVKEVESGKVVLDCAKIDAALKRAIGHAHDREDPRI
jgi:hypothetical protein